MVWKPRALHARLIRNPLIRVVVRHQHFHHPAPSLTCGVLARSPAYRGLLVAHLRGSFIGGRWQASPSAARIPCTPASTEDIIGSVAAGSADDVTAPWPRRAARSSPDGRSRRPRSAPSGCASWPTAWRSRKERTSPATISQEVGVPISMSTPIRPARRSSCCAASPICAHLALRKNIGHSLILREPVGVVGAITPWNYPLHQIIAKVAPALAAGCTVGRSSRASWRRSTPASSRKSAKKSGCRPV